MMNFHLQQVQLKVLVGLQWKKSIKKLNLEIVRGSHEDLFIQYKIFTEKIKKNFFSVSYVLGISLNLNNWTNEYI